MLKRLQSWLGDWGRWTGLHDYSDPTGEFHRGKTVWDWTQLLIIPGALLAIGYLIEEKRNTRDHELAQLRATDEARTALARATTEASLAQDRIQQTALETYLDRMTTLMLEYGLPERSHQADVQGVARAQTLATLRILSEPRIQG